MSEDSQKPPHRRKRGDERDCGARQLTRHSTRCSSRLRPTPWRASNRPLRLLHCRDGVLPPKGAPWTTAGDKSLTCCEGRVSPTRPMRQYRVCPTQLISSESLNGECSVASRGTC